MKLREKFQEQVEFPLYLKELQKLEKIADEYAIEFAEWLMDCHISELTLKEFKKQKGL